MSEASQRGKHWSDDDVKKLVRIWGTMPIEQVAKIFDRTMIGVYRKAEDLGLPLGVPQGHETINAAAKRLGVDRKYLLRILKSRHVHLHKSLRFEVTTKKRLFVDSYTATQAMQSVLDERRGTESLGEAAKRLGVYENTLRKILQSQGVAMPQFGSTNKYRLSTKDVDAAFQVYLNAESSKSAARRIGMADSSLRHWLKKAGIKPIYGRKYMLAPDDVNRIARERLADPKSKWRPKSDAA